MTDEPMAPAEILEVPTSSGFKYDNIDRFANLGMIRGEPPRHKAQRLLSTEISQDLDIARQENILLRETDINNKKIIEYLRCNEAVLKANINFLESVVESMKEKLHNILSKDL